MFSVSMRMVVNVHLEVAMLMIEDAEPIAKIPIQESKATVAGWSYLDRYIIMGHENGMVSQWDWKVSPYIALTVVW